MLCRKEDTKVPRAISIVGMQKDSTPLEVGEKRKRGRPPRTNTRKGRAALKPQRRTRARIGKRAVKINSGELENSDSVDESDGREADEPMEEIHGDLERHESSEVDKEEESSRRAEGMKDHERTHIANLAESGVIQENSVEDRFSRGSIVVPVAESAKKGTGEQVEQMVDPLQAMLLDMIPTLSQKREGTASSSVSVVARDKLWPDPDASPVKKKETAGSSVAVVEGDKSQPDPDANPVKKKKVSYKDVAGHLLKDW